MQERTNKVARSNTIQQRFCISKGLSEGRLRVGHSLRDPMKRTQRTTRRLRDRNGQIHQRPIHEMMLEVISQKHGAVKTSTRLEATSPDDKNNKSQPLLHMNIALKKRMKIHTNEKKDIVFP